MLQLPLALWAGALWAVGYIAVPAAFRVLHDRSLAGRLAEELFSIVFWLGLICACWVLCVVSCVPKFLPGRSNSQGFRLLALLVCGSTVLASLSYLGLQPNIAKMRDSAMAMTDRFKLLHGLAAIAYLCQSLLGAWMLVLAGACVLTKPETGQPQS